MARRRKKAPNKKTPTIQTKEPNSQTLDENKSWRSWWKGFATSTGLSLVLLLGQIVFGDGAFWQWRQEDLEKAKYRTELYRNLHQHITQARQLERERIATCLRKETKGSEKYYVALSASEKAETGCYEKEENLSLLNGTITVQEEELAKLEHREPKNLTIEIIPAPATPTDLRME